MDEVVDEAEAEAEAAGDEEAPSTAALIDNASFCVSVMSNT